MQVDVLQRRRPVPVWASAGTWLGIDRRVKAGGDGARADMLADGNTLYVFTNDGKLIAYEISAKS